METPNFKKLFGRDVPILSGALHYFRVHPFYWRDRLEKMAACGLNTVETYVPWNMHEPKEGQFDFEGIADIVKFVETAADVGLKVIVRPGPYICTEWEYGGLPGWLNAIPNMRIRCNWPDFMEKVENYFAVLLPKLVPYLESNGGPIFAMQVENEYGSYGSDKAYLSALRDMMRKYGMDCLFFTSDGTGIDMLKGGTLPDMWATANFGSNPEGAFKAYRAFQPNGPDMCMEFWCGWFDHWIKPRVKFRGAADVANTLERIIKPGGSVNFYMFHGGTNFGFWNGANLDGQTYHPTTTSYDYFAPLSEAGDMTDTYYACKEVIERLYGPAPDIKVQNTKKRAYGKVKLGKRHSLWDNLPAPAARAAVPLTFEEIGQELGYVLYRTTVDLPKVSREFLKERGYKQHLKITNLRDRAVVCIDGKRVGSLYRNNPNDTLEIPLPEGKDSFQLDILVENMGRVNYVNHGGIMSYPCGIFGTVSIGITIIYDWETFSLPFDAVPAPKGGECKDSPGFYTAEFNVDGVADTFLDMSGFRKGVVWINGFNLGRFWEVGPAKTLYVPAPILKEGVNQLVIFETDGVDSPTGEVEFVTDHVWVKHNEFKSLKNK
ncbi:MAG: beta-galactosidase [Oscillospiraceae bacterium]|nr:beta-galactosidase [Oscillospiraceae bacterium]